MWTDYGPAAFAIAIIIAIIASLHAVLYKRDVRAAIGWAGFIWVAPYVGAIFYLLFGINRIKRSATALRTRVRTIFRPAQPELPVRVLPDTQQHLSEHAELGDRVCGNSLVEGNRIEILNGGERALAVMLEAIDAASRSVVMSTYIFENDKIGRRFVEVLATAASRGVQVRVLVDAVGSRAGGSGIVAALSDAGVRAARFLPPRIPLGILSVNLRNHRKLLIVDGATAFTGGTNISDDYTRIPGPNPRIHDVHFAIDGPVVAELHLTFARDWLFTTGEYIEAAAETTMRGDVSARVVADGPDEDFEQSRWLMLGAITAARRSIRICTPYFLPDISMITTLSVAALRGVDVEILIPEALDHRVVKWASNALLWQVLEKGCRIWFTPPPFDHSKLFTVDGTWALIGSSNWDARSMRLNFELNVEGFGTTLAKAIDNVIDERRARSREITLTMMDNRSLPVRIRDGVARLFVPYL